MEGERDTWRLVHHTRQMYRWEQRKAEKRRWVCRALLWEMWYQIRQILISINRAGLGLCVLILRWCHLTSGGWAGLYQARTNTIPSLAKAEHRLNRETIEQLFVWCFLTAQINFLSISSGSKWVLALYIWYWWRGHIIISMVLCYIWKPKAWGQSAFVGS